MITYGYNRKPQILSVIKYEHKYDQYSQIISVIMDKHDRKSYEHERKLQF